MSSATTYLQTATADLGELRAQGRLEQRAEGHALDADLGELGETESVGNRPVDRLRGDVER